VSNRYFSRLLTDQEAQFVGKLVQELCSLLVVDQVRTSLYNHPETNTCVGRMHSTLESVLAKCISLG